MLGFLDQSYLLQTNDSNKLQETTTTTYADDTTLLTSSINADRGCLS